MVALKDHADALACEIGALLAIELVRGGLVKPVFAEPTVVEKSEDIQQRRLPCP